MGNIKRFDGQNTRKRIHWQTPAEYLREHPVPEFRLPTPFPFLNDAFGGGLWPIMVFTVQGAPGAGKSSFGIQLAAHCATVHGCHVYILASDEGTRAACVRIGQFSGADRELLELTRPEALDALELATKTDRLHVVEADAEEAVFETFLDQITEEYRPGDPPPILYADSIQTIRTDLDDTFEVPRFRIGYIMELARQFSRAVPMIVLFVSHVNRLAFAAKKEEDRIDPLAAPAEAIEITRASDAVLDLAGDLQDPNGVKAWLRKNRLHRGEKPKRSLRYDIPHGNFAELDSTEIADQKAAAKTADHEKTVTKIADKIETTLKKAGHRLGFRQIKVLIGGKEQNIREALAGLEAQGAIDWEAGPKNSILWGPKPKPVA